MFPYCREVGVFVGKVEKGSEVTDAQRSKVFELVYCEVVGTWSGGIFTVSDGFVYCSGGEGGVVVVKVVMSMYPAYELSGGRVAGVWCGSSELFDEAICNLTAVRYSLPPKGDRLVWIKRAAFSG